MLRVSSAHYPFAKPQKINYPKGRQTEKYSCQHRAAAFGQHMIDFQTLLICDGDFSMDECTIDVLLPAYNGTKLER